MTNVIPASGNEQDERSEDRGMQTLIGVSQSINAALRDHLAPRTTGCSSACPVPIKQCQRHTASKDEVRGEDGDGW